MTAASSFLSLLNDAGIAPHRHARLSITYGTAMHKAFSFVLESKRVGHVSSFLFLPSVLGLEARLPL